MTLRSKVILPVLFIALLFVAYLFWRWHPAMLPNAERNQIVATVLVALASSIAIVWLSLEWFVRRPLQDIARRHLDRSARDPDTGKRPARQDEIAQIARTIEELRETARLSQIEAAEQLGRRKHAEESLKETEERYALAVRGANDGLWEWNLASGVMYFSPRWKSMLGFAEAELQDSVETWNSRIHPDDVDKVNTIMQAHIEGSVPRFESEHRLMHRDGTHRWILSRACAIRHATGKPYRMVGLDTDITSFKRIEEILIRVADGTAGTTGEAFFRALVKNFAQVLGVRVAFISECVNFPATRVRALAFWDGGSFLENVEYDLAGTPCAEVIGQGAMCFYPRDLVSHFPAEAGLGLESYLGIPITDTDGKTIGHLAFLDAKRMDDGILLTTIYKIFTARAAGELARKRVQTTVLELAKGLSEVRGEECFRVLARNFADVTAVREAIVAQCIDLPTKRVRVLAWWRDGRFESNTEFDLAGNSYEQAIDEGTSRLAADGGGEGRAQVQAFQRQLHLGLPCHDAAGRVIGHITCFDDKPRQGELPDQAILRLFAERVTLELERKQLRGTLQQLGENLSRVRGDTFFRALVQNITRALNIREAFICECCDYPTTQVRMLARWNKEDFAPCVEFDLAGTSCEEVILKGKPVYWPSGVGERLPREKQYDRESYLGIPCFDSEGRVIGHITCADGKPMHEEEPEWAILKLIAERAAIELERKQLGDERRRVQSLVSS